MEPSANRLLNIRSELVNKHDFEPKLADGVSTAVCEAVLLVYEGIEATEARISSRFQELEEQVKRSESYLIEYFEEHFNDIRRTVTKGIREGERLKNKVSTYEDELDRKNREEREKSDDKERRTFVGVMCGSGLLILFSFLVIVATKGCVA